MPESQRIYKEWDLLDIINISLDILVKVSWKAEQEIRRMDRDNLVSLLKKHKTELIQDWQNVEGLINDLKNELLNFGFGLN